METKKKSIILSIVAVAILIALVVGATFAYFQAQVGNSAFSDIKVTTYTTDVLTFETGNDITIYADQTNFADGLGNQTGETFARAYLLANNKTNTATANYFVYLNVTNNTFEYTQGDETAELLLQVTDPNGKEVTSLSGLEYKTVIDGKGSEVNGFDVTTFDGIITIANNYEIVANNENEQTWIVKLVFVNLDADQTKNGGHGLSSNLIIQKEKDKSLLTMADICSSNQSLASCVKSMYGTDNTLYYHDSNLANGAEDNSYRYAGADNKVNNFVCFGSDEETCKDDNLYRIIGVFGDQAKLIKWDYATSSLLGTDGDYKDTYQTVSSGNRGTSKGTNSQTEIGAYWWNYEGTEYGTNTWSASELNTVNLNINYLNNIGTEWSRRIAETTWKVGGYMLNLDIPAGPTTTEAYKNEYANPSETITVGAKVGLMYTSDYGFATSPIWWKAPMNNYSFDPVSGNKITEENWMYMGLYEWTVVRMSNSFFLAFYISGDGNVLESWVGFSTSAFGARPVFYLESSVNYVSGSGTKNDPIRLG